MAASGKYRAVLFDLYGTLLDIHTDEEREETWQALADALVEAGGTQVPTAELRVTFAEELAKVKAKGEGIDWYEPDLLPVYRALLTRAGLPASHAAASQLAWRFRKASTVHIAPFPGAIQLLRQLKSEGYRVVLVSNAQASYTRPELRLFNLDDEFDRILISSEEGVRKPSAELFRRVLKREGFKPCQAIMVGNDEYSDIAGARAAGIDAVYLYTDSNTGAPTAKRAVCSLKGADYVGLLEFLHSAARQCAHNEEQGNAQARA